MIAALAILCPFVAAAVGMLLGRRLPPGAIAIAGTALSAAFALVLLTHPGETTTVLAQTGSVPLKIGTRVDGLSAPVAVMVTLVALVIQVYSTGYLRGDKRYSSYAALVSLFTAAMLTVVLAADLIELYVGWEVMGGCSYFLIGHHWERPAASAAAVKSFLMTRFGDIGFLVGIFVLGTAARSFRIADVLAAVPTMSHGTLLAGSLLLTLGVVGKSAQFPLHSWLPDAMAGPAPVSALIHAATMVAAGAYVVALLYGVFVAAPVTLTVLAVLAVISMLGAALAALATDDLKRVLAYSTISQLSLMFAALVVGGRTAAVSHLFSHAAFKALLFLGAGVVIQAVGSNLMADMGGLRRNMPITFVTMTIGFAALAGLPPTSGFFSKDAIVAATGRHWPVLAAILLTEALTAAYATRAWRRTFFGPAQRSAREGSAVLLGPLVALAVPALLLGLVEPRPNLATAWITLLPVALGVGAGWFGWQRDLGPLFATACHTDDLYERTVVRAVLRLSDRVGGLDDGIGDTVTGTGRGAGRLGALLRRTQNGNPQFYLTGVLAGVVLIAVGAVVLA